MKRKMSMMTVMLLVVSLMTSLLSVGAAPSSQAGGALPAYLDPAGSVEARAADLLSRMTLEERAGQMIQPEKANITPEEVKQYFIGSVLSGGGSFPNGKQQDSTREKWQTLIDSYQDGALSTRLGIPLLYGVDGVHGHNNVKGTTLFPHNIGLGAANNAELVKQIGAATAKEIRSTGANWDFAPTIAAPQDIRWGRTYEGYSGSQAISKALGAAYIEGLQGETAAERSQTKHVVGAAKHFIGEGYTDNGTNQGNITKYTEDELLASDLSMYKAAVDAGVQTVMASYHSIQGLKMHANKRLLTDVLKGELGFKGFVISDYNAIQQITRDQDGKAVSGLKNQLLVSVNAGVDMFMLTGDWKASLNHLISLVKDGSITEERLNDAVLRILKVKISSGLFENPKADADLAGYFGADEHRTLARQAVAESLVLLKNDVVNGSPIMSQLKGMDKVFVAGKNANDIGNQAGGWSITWQGASGAITTGTTIYEGLKEVAGAGKTVTYNKHGRGAAGYDVAIAVVGETPYAETAGDRTSLNLDEEDLATIANIRAADPSIPLVVVLVSGRPLTIADQMDDWDALVAAWLPGTEGQGVADVLIGDKAFKGKNPIKWPFYLTNYPIMTESSPNLLFPIGYGLTSEQATPALPAKPVQPEAPSQPLPGKLEAESFVAKSSGLNTEDTQDTGGGKNVGWTTGGAWLDYTVKVNEPGTYSAAFRYAGNGGATGMKNKTEEGATVGTLSVGSTGGWQSWQTATVDNVVLSKAGVQKLRLEFIAGDINFNWVEFTRTGDVPAGGGGSTEPGNGGEEQPVLVAGAVESWISSERDAGNRQWYYADRYLAGDKKLEQQANLDFTLPDNSKATTITIDPDKTYQSMLGIGSSMEEATIHNLVKMSPSKQEELLRSLIDKENGIGMSLVRLTIGTSDFTAQKFYSYNDLPAGETDVELSKFSIQKDIDFGIIPTVKKMQAINSDVKFFASPWSPPGWMKTTDSMVRGQVKEEYLPVLAAYYVKFLEAYAEHGIYFEGMTLQNEPLLEIDYPSTAMSWQQASRLAKLLRAKLDQNSNEKIKNVKLWMFDHNPGDTMAYPAQILGNPVEGAYDAIEGTAFHDYGGELSMMTTLQNLFPEKSVYLTERAVWGTSGADRIAQYFRNYARSYNSWVTMLDSDISTHQWVGIPDPTPIVQDSSNPDNYWKLPEYYLMGQFTKFVKPGYVRIDSNYGSAATVTNVAFASPDGSEIVTVVINQTNDPQPFKMLIDGLQINAVIPAKSAATYRWDRTQIANVPATIDATRFASAEGVYQVNPNGYLGSFDASGTAAFDYVVHVDEAGEYDLDLALAGKQRDASVDFSLEGQPLVTLPIKQPTYEWENFTNQRVRVVLPAGTHKLTMAASKNDYNIKSITFTKAEAAPIQLPGLIEASKFTAALNVLVNGSAVSYADPNDWMEYQVQVPADGSYGITYQYATEQAGAKAELSSDAAVLQTTDLPSSNGWDAWATVTDNVTLTEGLHTLRIRIVGSAFNLKAIAVGPAILAETAGITEGAEAGSELIVKLYNDSFKEELTAANWSIAGYAGTVVDSVYRVDDHTAKLVVGGFAARDYDSDRAVTVTSSVYEAASGSLGQTMKTQVLFKANNDAESLSLSDSALAYGVNGKELVLSIAGGTFVEQNLNAITLSGSGTTQGGVSLRSAELLTPQSVKLTLNWNETVYYNELELQVNVPVNAYDDSTGGTALTARTALLGTENVKTPIHLLTFNSLDQFNKLKGFAVTGSGSSSGLTQIDAGDYADYLVHVPAAGPYVVTLKATSNGQALNGIALEAENGAVRKTITVPNLYNQVVELRVVIDLKEGDQKIRLAAGASGYSLSGIKFEPHIVQVMDQSAAMKIEAESYSRADAAAVQSNMDGQTLKFKNVGFIAAAGSLYFDVSIAKTGFYKATYRYATPQAGVSGTLSVDGHKLSTTPLGASGGWDSYTETSGIVQLAEGMQTIQFTSNNDGANLDWIALEETEAVAPIEGVASLPTASLKVGAYKGTKTVELASATEGASIYYTTDGTMPSSTNGQLYNGPLTLSELAVLRVIAVKAGMKDSFVAPFTYIITPGEVQPTPEPTVTPEPTTDPSTEPSTKPTASPTPAPTPVATPAPTTAPSTAPGGKAISAPAPVIDAASGLGKTTISQALINSALKPGQGSNDVVQVVTVEVPKVNGAKGYEVQLPKESISAAKLAVQYEIVTSAGTVTVPSNMLASLPADAKSVSIVISGVDKTKLSEAAQAALGNRLAVELNLYVDGVKVEWSNPEAAVNVSIAYSPSAEELRRPELITVWYIDSAGKIIAVPSGKYDKAKGAVTFTVHHFSTYAVAFVNKSFDDLGKHVWAKQAIEVMASKGVINGVSEKAYAPAEQVKRADFISLLVKALGLSAAVDGNFSDVAKDAYYYDAVAIAKKLGIVTGREDGAFDPNASITRQEMIAMTARALHVSGKKLEAGSAEQLKPFTDLKQLASYAESSAALLVANGIVKGDGSKLNPLGHTTRAEAAVIMYAIYNK
ncbi:glycoside hydrolase family 3 N-terminal domain-containing protein [Paenibacillus sp. PL91]|uniref:glycoside hydrolase family 3 N-terminal domain-containing protein n=1 Tax=Paenibacillus sp. PL91 TaxID=2729538 RepID=UPI0021D52301|nr:glycoside hydrolase family 3 N-terminal domain-containing protein [Paenibacillus sp. PL91]